MPNLSFIGFLECLSIFCSRKLGFLNIPQLPWLMNQKEIPLHIHYVRTCLKLRQHYLMVKLENDNRLYMSWKPPASQVMQLVKNPPAKAGDTRDAGSILGSGRSPGGGHGNPLQCSCLGNPMDREAWWAEVHGVAKRVRHDWATEHVA